MNRCVWANEIDKFACKIYRRHWDDGTLLQGDIRDVFSRLESGIAGTIDVICGGDPCPARSLARGNRPSKHPDLSGYFLAVVGRLRPRWVVRENVCAPDIINFAAGLELLGYGVAAVALDARDFTGQSRRRQFCIGCPPTLRAGFERSVSDALLRRAWKRKRPLQRVLLRTPTGWLRKTLTVTSRNGAYECSIRPNASPCRGSPEAGLLDYLAHAVESCSAMQ